MTKLQKVFSDRLLGWAAGATAYFLLIAAILYVRDERSVVYGSLLGASVLLFIVRLFVALAKKPGAKTARKTFADTLTGLRSLVISLCYVWLMGIVLEPRLEKMWIIYALTAVLAIGLVISLAVGGRSKS